LQNVDSKSLADSQAFSFDIDERTRRLELIAAWADGLRARIWDEPAQLDLENIEVWGEQQNLEALRAEVEQFKLACKGVRA
jgi:hypothetical protein